MKFGQKLTIAEFKELNNCTSLNIVRNPKTDKLFVTANGSTVAAVSKNYESSKGNAEFVELIMEDDGSKVWCLHNANTDNVVETL